MTADLQFNPLPLLSSSHIQTILASLFKPIKRPESEVLEVFLPDGDVICCELSNPPHCKSDQKIIILIHGLGGSHQSGYMIRMTNRFLKKGYRVVRINLRGCGSGEGRSRLLYHGGISADVLAVLEALRATFPFAPLHLIGYSLGGNITLKLAGELSHNASSLLKQVIAICPPIDLATSTRQLSLPKNRIYSQYFRRRLLQQVESCIKAFPDIERPVLPEFFNLEEFDEKFTAIQWGFKNAADYYEKSSSGPLLPEIKVPCHILFAVDDPIIDHRVTANYSLPANIQVWKCNKGGHMGFLGLARNGKGVRWLDHQVMHWVENPQ